ncbi:hypothetical protein C8T65DRAFT_648035 [Cerioporus squamosus]|nr:hypothetical protein C8T65DRAFT_648035 [Cerioporus squamosus]
METLAPEILHKIYTLACTDGGLTGCSLSLVSKHVRSTSSSARFHSVAISGTSRQLAEFLSLFIIKRAVLEVDGYMPVVKHLFFAAAEGEDNIGDWRTDLLPWDVDVDVDVDAEDNNRASIDAAREKYLLDVATLFRLVAPDLQTLSFVHCHGRAELTHLSGIECPTGLPVLRELTMIGDDPFVGAASPVFYPCLTRLHLDGPSWQHNKLPSWAERSPQVTHLCLSDINNITQPLEDVAATGSPFRKLSHLYVQPEAPPSPGGWCGNPYIEHAMFMADFVEFPNTATIPTHALRHRDGPIEKWIRQEWLDRIGGGFGCWVPFEPKTSGIAQLT